MRLAHAEGRAFKAYEGYCGYTHPNSPRLRGKTKEEIEEILISRKNIRKEKLLNEDFNTLKFDRLRERVFLEQGNKCNRCNLNEWMGKLLSLELDHKDGNNLNNARGNLEGLCPNCHSLTPTWRGRNRKDLIKTKITTEEDMVKAYLEAGNIRQCLLKLGLAAKGANYGRVKRALSLWGIDYKNNATFE